MKGKREGSLDFLNFHHSHVSQKVREKGLPEHLIQDP
jgi:hypothetical protein